MSDGEVKFKVGQKVVCSDGEIPTVVGTVIGMVGESPDKTEWVGVKVSEDFLKLFDFWHDGASESLIDEQGNPSDFQSERDDCRFYRPYHVKVLGEV